jgi:serine phosphatase RsbU (regulator of sigma subunit)
MTVGATRNDEPRATPVRVLLVEDDDGDAFLVGELLQDADDTFEIVRVRTLHEARALLDSADCVVLDLGLPDAEGIDAVRALGPGALDVPVVVLTGLVDRHRGPEAVAAGAQDYLVKGEVDGRILGRAMRYAIERLEVERAGRRVLLAERRQLENEHLARGLLPRPLVSEGREVVTRYRPGGPEALLGGDFFDAVELDDGSLRLVIGDVCGHGPDEAAVGVALRISWRALVIGECSSNEALDALDEVFLTEQRGDAVFATVCDIEVAPDRRSMQVHLCGHPPPLLLGASPRWLDELVPRAPLGLAVGQPFESQVVELPEDWSLLLVTDGVYEGRDPSGARFGAEGIERTLRDLLDRGLDPGAVLDELIDAARRAHGGDLPDDVALLWVGGSSADG